MESIGWLSIREQNEVTTATQTWKIAHLRKPARLADRMELKEDFKLETQGLRLMFSADCYRWRAIGEWNQLSTELRAETSIDRFKVLMKRTTAT